MIHQPLFSAGWELLKNKNGVKLYQRQVKGSHLKEFLAITIIDARMEVIGEVLRDVKSQPSWLPTCILSSIIEKIDRNKMILYTVMDSPWPTKDRDIVIRNNTKYDLEKGRTVIKFKSIKDKRVPINKDRARITHLEGSYKMEYIARNRTRFILRQIVDPGGSVPYKLAYITIRSQPHKTLVNLKRMVKKRKYINAAKKSPDKKLIDKLSRDEKNVRETLIRRLSKYFKDKKVINRIITENKKLIKEIIQNNGSYKSTREATNFFISLYIATLTKNKSIRKSLSKDKSLERDITDMILYDYGYRSLTVDRIVSRYIKKYSR